MGRERIKWAQETGRRKRDGVGGGEEIREDEVSGMTSEFLVCVTVWIVRSFTKTSISSGGSGPREEDE